MKIIYFKTGSGKEPVKDYIISLPEADRAILTGDFELILEYGLTNAPVSTRKMQGKQFKGKLWELKSGTRTQQRIFYCLENAEFMILLHACKKQKQAGQKRDLKLALKRMKEVLS